MRHLLAAIVIVLATVIPCAQPMSAKDAEDRDAVGEGSATILTDGIADPNGPISLGVGVLAARLSTVGTLRVLPLMGHGGVGNVRDLLHLRGVDLAILNSDILAYLDLTGEYPTARDRVRYVTQLTDETVYLLVRKPLATLDQLAKRKVAILAGKGAGHVTAHVVFERGKTPVEFVEVEARPTIDAAGLVNVDAILLVGREISRLKLTRAEADAWALAPIVPDKGLASVYRPVEIAPSELPGLAPSAPPVPSIKLATLLAVFDWQKDKARYQSVLNVLRAIFAGLGDLKRTAPDTFWPGADINAAIPDWRRYEPADELRRRVPAADAIVVNKEVSAPAPAVVAALRSDEQVTRLLLADRPPLSGVNLASGGLIGELVSESLGGGEAGAGRRVELAEDARLDPVASLAEALGDVAAPVDLPNCDRPGDLARPSAATCDAALISDPLFSVVTGLFTRSDSDFDFETDESVFGRTICVPDNVDTSDLNRDGRNWVRDNKIKLVRPATLIECLSLVETREADAVMASELEGANAIERLGLTDGFRMAERPIATHSLHAVALKSAEKAADLIADLNRGVARLKQNGEYAAIVAKHLSGLWSSRKTE